MYKATLLSFMIPLDGIWTNKWKSAPHVGASLHCYFLILSWTDSVCLVFSCFYICCPEQRGGVNKERYWTALFGITSSSVSLIRKSCPFILWGGGGIRPPWVNTSLFCFLSSCWELKVARSEKRKLFCSSVRSRTNPPRPPETQLLPVFPVPPHPLLLLLHLQPLYTDKSICAACSQSPCSLF